MNGPDSDSPARQRIGTTLVVMSAALASGGTAGARDETDVLARIKEAVGHQMALPLALEGEAESCGSKGTFTLQTGPAGKFRQRIEAPLGRTRGDDGVSGWEVDSSGMPRRLDADERDRARLTTWIWTGQWLDPTAKVMATLKPRQQEGSDVILEVGFADHRWRAELLIDGRTWLPRSLTSSGASGPEVVEFSGYIEHRGRKVARVIASRTSGIPTLIGNVTAIRLRRPTTIASLRRSTGGRTTQNLTQAGRPKYGSSKLALDNGWSIRPSTESIWAASCSIVALRQRSSRSKPRRSSGCRLSGSCHWEACSERWPPRSIAPAA